MSEREGKNYVDAMDTIYAPEKLTDRIRALPLKEAEGAKYVRRRSKVKFAVMVSTLTICLVLCIAVQGKRKSSIPRADRQEDDWQNHLGNVVDDDGNRIYEEEDEGLAIKSQDGKCKVFMKGNERLKLYIYHAEEEKLDEIDVRPMDTDIGDIMSLGWIDTDQVAVFCHLSPSGGCLGIYDVNTLQKLEEKLCAEYSWVEGIDSLVYVEPAPRRSSEIGKEKILNADDEIIYQTKKFETIYSMDSNARGDIAIVVDKLNKYYDIQSRKLMILKKNGKRYQVKEKISLKDGEGGEFEWIDYKTISYSTGEGGKKVREIAN